MARSVKGEGDKSVIIDVVNKVIIPNLNFLNATNQGGIYIYVVNPAGCDVGICVVIIMVHISSKLPLSGVECPISINQTKTC